MGAVFCDCEKKKNGYVDGSVPDFDSKLPSLQSGVPQTEIKGMNKGEHLNAIWASLDKSSTVGKGVGNPKEKYEFIEQIGLGTFEQVFKVKIKKSGDLRAMKVIKKQDHSISFEKSVVHEIEMLESVDHPNVLKVFEFYDCPEHICIVSELGEGGSLSQCLDTIVKESEIVKAHIIFQLLSAINYCHSMNIMHRDIQPDNILVSPKTSTGVYNIKLIDFGTAKIFLNIQHQLTGSPQFIAPEVIKGDYNEKCDLWSCGIILYGLFKGSYPFTGKNNKELFENILSGHYDIRGSPFDTVNNDTKDLIQKLLKVDPASRISAQKALDHPWFKRLKIKEKYFDVDFEMVQTLLNHVLSYSPTNSLQKPVIAYLIHNHGDRSTEIKHANNLFAKIDINNNGTLDRREFIINCINFYRKYGQQVDDKFLGTIFDKIDYDHSKQIGYREFVCAAVDKNVFIKDDFLQEAFNFFDKDKNGTISLDEVKRAFSSMKGYKDKDFEEILRGVDLNKDGKIDFYEFKTMMQTIIV